VLSLRQTCPLRHIDGINPTCLFCTQGLYIQHTFTQWARVVPTPMQHIDGINLFGLISIASLVYCLPAALYFESGMWKVRTAPYVLRVVRDCRTSEHTAK
jgi:hypothetical protein